MRLRCGPNSSCHELNLNHPSVNLGPSIIAAVKNGIHISERAVWERKKQKNSPRLRLLPKLEPPIRSWSRIIPQHPPCPRHTRKVLDTLKPNFHITPPVKHILTQHLFKSHLQPPFSSSSSRSSSSSSSIIRRRRFRGRKRDRIQPPLWAVLVGIVCGLGHDAVGQGDVGREVMRDHAWGGGCFAGEAGGDGFVDEGG